MLVIIDRIIDSFTVSSSPQKNKGIPLGNATSQLFANIYLHEADYSCLDRKLQSYLGILSDTNQYDLSQALKNAYCVRNSS